MIDLRTCFPKAAAFPVVGIWTYFACASATFLPLLSHHRCWLHVCFQICAELQCSWPPELFCFGLYVLLVFYFTLYL